VRGWNDIHGCVDAAAMHSTLSSAARLTQRTLVFPSLEPLHRRHLALGDILDLRELKSFW
jgi:hypothetical protein